MDSVLNFIDLPGLTVVLYNLRGKSVAYCTPSFCFFPCRECFFLKPKQKFHLFAVVLLL